MRKTPCILILIAFLFNSLGPLPAAQADEFRLPAPGMIVPLSPQFNPPILKGIKVDPNNPFRFDFILDQGDEGASNSIKPEATRLIKYFLASLTVPENDLWVNLSPYEKNRIIPNSFGLTEMGRDLLAEDYMLKQITASLIYPEDAIGKRFWKRIYQEAQKKFGTTNIPVNTFNKVWIVPDKAVVYENAKAGTAYVVESKLKVMLEQDYLALSHSVIPANAGIQDTSSLGNQIVREIVIPELTREVNQGKNFSQLRQVYNSLILAAWYKRKIKDSILEQVYADKNKTAGITPLVSLRGQSPKQSFSTDTEFIYQRYLQAFKKGVYNYIKEEQDPLTQEMTPRKYFSGGFFGGRINAAMTVLEQMPLDAAMLKDGQAQQITVRLDQAMNSEEASPQAVMDMLFAKDFDLGYKINNVLTNLLKPSIRPFQFENICEFLTDPISIHNNHLWPTRQIRRRAYIIGELLKAVYADTSVFSPKVKEIAFLYESEISPFYPSPNEIKEWEDLGKEVEQEDSVPEVEQYFEKKVRESFADSEEIDRHRAKEDLKLYFTQLINDKSKPDWFIASVMEELFNVFGSENNPRGKYLALILALRAMSDRKYSKVIFELVQKEVHVLAQESRISDKQLYERIGKLSASFFGDDNFLRVDSVFGYLEEWSAKDFAMTHEAADVVNTEEAQQILSKTEVRGHGYKGRALTKTVINSLGMFPIRKIDIHGRQIAFSRPYKISVEGRVAVLAYVQEDDHYVARTFYLSNSQAMWRYLPGVLFDKEGNIVWYHKGHSEDSLNLTYEIQEALSALVNSQKSINILKEDDGYLLFAGTTWNNIDSYLGKVDTIPERVLLNANDNPLETGTYLYPESIVLRSENWPDFDNMLTSFFVPTDFYGKVRVRVFESVNKKYIFSFMSDQRGRCWVGSIEKNGNGIASNGLKKQWVYGGSLSVPAFEYEMQASGYGNNKDRKLVYVDMWTNYLSKVTVIKTFQKKFVAGHTLLTNVGAVSSTPVGMFFRSMKQLPLMGHVILSFPENGSISLKMGNSYLQIRKSDDGHLYAVRVTEDGQEQGYRYYFSNGSGAIECGSMDGYFRMNNTVYRDWYDQGVSHKHALIQLLPENKILIEDLGAANIAKYKVDAAMSFDAGVLIEKALKAINTKDGQGMVAAWLGQKPLVRFWAQRDNNNPMQLSVYVIDINGKKSVDPIFRTLYRSDSVTDIEEFLDHVRFAGESMDADLTHKGFGWTLHNKWASTLPLGTRRFSVISNIRTLKYILDDLYVHGNDVYTKGGMKLVDKTPGSESLGELSAVSYIGSTPMGRFIWESGGFRIREFGYINDFGVKALKVMLQKGYMLGFFYRAVKERDTSTNAPYVFNDLLSTDILDKVSPEIIDKIIEALTPAEFKHFHAFSGSNTPWGQNFLVVKRFMLQQTLNTKRFIQIAKLIGVYDDLIKLNASSSSISNAMTSKMAELLNDSNFIKAHFGLYHDLLHALDSGETEALLVRLRKVDEPLAFLLILAAYIHDFEMRNEGKMAHVPATLQHLDDDYNAVMSLKGEVGKSFLRELFAVHAKEISPDLQYLIVKAIIQRSEFPFVGRPGDLPHYNNFYNEHNTTPLDEYEATLIKIGEHDPELLDKVRVEAYVFAEMVDKGNPYMHKKTFKDAVKMVEGLIQELRKDDRPIIIKGQDLTESIVLKGTAAFMKNIGSINSSAPDKYLEGKLKLKQVNFPTRDEIFVLMSQDELGKQFVGRFNEYMSAFEKEYANSAMISEFEDVQDEKRFDLLDNNAQNELMEKLFLLEQDKDPLGQNTKGPLISFLGDHYAAFPLIFLKMAALEKNSLFARKLEIVVIDVAKKISSSDPVYKDVLEKTKVYNKHLHLKTMVYLGLASGKDLTSSDRERVLLLLWKDFQEQWEALKTKSAERRELIVQYDQLIENLLRENPSDINEWIQILKSLDKKEEERKLQVRIDKWLFWLSIFGNQRVRRAIQNQNREKEVVKNGGEKNSNFEIKKEPKVEIVNVWQQQKELWIESNQKLNDALGLKSTYSYDVALEPEIKIEPKKEGDYSFGSAPKPGEYEDYAMRASGSKAMTVATDLFKPVITVQGKDGRLFEFRIDEKETGHGEYKYGLYEHGDTKFIAEGSINLRSTKRWFQDVPSDAPVVVVEIVKIPLRLQNNGVYTAFLKDFPANAYIFNEDIENRETVVALLKAVLKVDLVRNRFLDLYRNIDNLCRLLRVNQDEYVPGNLRQRVFEVLNAYQDISRYFGSPSLSKIINEEEVINNSPLLKPLVNAGFKHHEARMVQNGNRLMLVTMSHRDFAMIENHTGGIDLTPANMHLQTQNAGTAIKFHLDPAELARLQNATGFVPVIINIQPVTNLRMFLGINDPAKVDKSA